MAAQVQTSMTVIISLKRKIKHSHPPPPPPPLGLNIDRCITISLGITQIIIKNYYNLTVICLLNEKTVGFVGQSKVGSIVGDQDIFSEFFP